MPERIGAAKELYAMIIVWIAMSIGRALTADSDINYRKLSGEIILACVGAYVFYAFGMYQGMEKWQMIFFGCMGSVGGVHTIEQTARVIRSISRGKE